MSNNQAYEIPGFKFGVLPANADLTQKQYLAADVSAAAGAPGIVQAAAGAPMLGVIQGAPQMGEAVELMCSGVSKVKLGGTVAVDDLLAVDANGAFETAAAGQFAVAKALQAGPAGALVSAFLHNYGKQ